MFSSVEKALMLKLLTPLLNLRRMIRKSGIRNFTSSAKNLHILEAEDDLLEGIVVKLNQGN